MKTIQTFSYEEFHSKFSQARNNLQKKQVRLEHAAFMETLSAEEQATYRKGLQAYGQQVMKDVETQLQAITTAEAVE